MGIKKFFQNNMSDMKILVTGGAGFIGSNLVKILLDRGYAVTVLDDFSVGRMENLTFEHGNLEVVKGSVCNIDLIRKLMSKTDTVFHLAVQCLVKCNENPIISHDVNVGGTFNVCLAAYEAHAKIVHVSSSEIYGTCKFSPMTEDHPKDPQSIYGLSKLMGEEYVTHFNKYYGVPAVIIRPFNTYGPNHRDDQYSAVITAFIRRLDNGEYPIIEWTGEQSRDFTYVTDVTECISLFGNRLSNGEIVNIGSGKCVTIKEIAIILMNIYGIDNPEEKLIYAKKRPNDVWKLEADTSLANSYGYKPKVSLEEGLRKYVEWWKNDRGLRGR